MDALAALLLLAAEDGTAYEIGKVFGRAVVVVLLVALALWLWQRFRGSRD